MAIPTIQKAYYTAPDGQVHYRYIHAAVKDETKSPLLFMHMSACSSLYFERLMDICAALGYDCYAPDMPGFGGSYNPKYQPEGCRYYVEVFMILIKNLGLTKLHALGHHSGAAMGIEMAASYPSLVLSLTIIGPSPLTQEEWATFRAGQLKRHNDPVMDGSHLLKTWSSLRSNGEWDVIPLHGQVLDALRAFEGRLQCYTCVSRQDMNLLGEVKCLVLAMSSETDVLYKYLNRVKDVVSHPSI